MGTSDSDFSRQWAYAAAVVRKGRGQAQRAALLATALSRRKSQEAAPDWLKVCVSDTDPIPSLALPQVSPPAEDPVLPIRLHIHDMMLEIPAGTPPAYLSALLQVVRQA